MPAILPELSFLVWGGPVFVVLLAVAVAVIIAPVIRDHFKACFLPARVNRMVGGGVVVVGHAVEAYCTLVDP